MVLTKGLGNCITVLTKGLGNCITVLTKGLGNCIMASQATRLDTLGISLQGLVELRDNTDKEGFLRTLKDKGLRSKVLRDKLHQAVLRLT